MSFKASMEEVQTELARRDEVIANLVDCIENSKPIPMSAPDKSEFAGTCGEFRYQFEGEDDLLHLIITRLNEEPLAPEEAQPVVEQLIPNPPTGLLWLKPGIYSQHFYLGHEILLAAWTR